ncbi:MAG TPA: sulfur carrier protein ThiS [Candidatus Eisenbacteria bacterium]|nr:sulfur carrier protein ThiS [Candidatus Eisenbacteria bacterium]
MKIRLNGEEREIGGGTTVAGLLEELKIRPARVVVELNRDVLTRERYASTLLNDGDVLEIVHFVGGG